MSKTNTYDRYHKMLEKINEMNNNEEYIKMEEGTMDSPENDKLCDELSYSPSRGFETISQIVRGIKKMDNKKTPDEILDGRKCTYMEWQKKFDRMWKRSNGVGGKYIERIEINRDKKDLQQQTESRKESKGKRDWSVLLFDALEQVVDVFEQGLVKYNGKRTWLSGIPFSKLFAASMRHLINWFFRGENKDAESGLHPLAHVAANALMLLTYINDEKFDDRPEKDKI